MLSVFQAAAVFRHLRISASPQERQKLSSYGVITPITPKRGTPMTPNPPRRCPLITPNTPGRDMPHNTYTTPVRGMPEVCLPARDTPTGRSMGDARLWERHIC